jgi:FkbM family methyltransferase
MSTEHDYDLSKKVKISFKGMDYFVMPRYKDHYLNHEYERFSLQILKNDLNEHSLFVDIGGHYGAYSLYAANSAGSKVIATEPVPENFSLLSQNIKINKLENLIVAHEYAASDINGEAEFNIPWASDSAGFYEHPNAATIKKLKVTTRKFDDILKEKKADLIKIDVEGHELSVLKGLIKTLNNNPEAKLIIELNPPLLDKANVDIIEFLEYVKGLKKELYLIDEDNFTLHRITDRLDAWPKYMNEGNYANLYCVPAQGHLYLLYVSHTANLGGAELAMCEQADELRKKNIFSHIVLPTKGPLENLLIDKGIGYSVIEGYSFWATDKNTAEPGKISPQQNYSNVKAAGEIAELARDLDSTAIVNNSIVNPWGTLGAKSLGLPLIWMVHEYGDKDHNLVFSHGIDATRQFVVEESDLVVSCSDSVKESLNGNVHKDNVHTIYNFIRSQQILELAEQPIKSPFTNEKSLKLCIAGTLSEGKGQKYAIEAVSELKKAGMNIELILIGSSYDNHKKHLQALVTKLNLNENVKFLGFQDNPYPFIRASDATIVTSQCEAFGRVTAESMILGTPVIGSNTGGTAELLTDKETGLLFNSGDAESLKNAIEELAKIDTKKMTLLAKKRIEALINTDRNSTKLKELITVTKLDRHQQNKNEVLNSELLDALQELKKEIHSHKNTEEQLKESLDTISKSNEQLQESLKMITESKSWKITKPLRRTSGRLKKFKE